MTSGVKGQATWCIIIPGLTAARDSWCGASAKGSMVLLVARSGVSMKAVSNHWYCSSDCASAYQRERLRPSYPR